MREVMEKERNRGGDGVERGGGGLLTGGAHPSVQVSEPHTAPLCKPWPRWNPRRQYHPTIPPQGVSCPIFKSLMCWSPGFIVRGVG